MSIGALYAQHLSTLQQRVETALPRSGHDQ